MYEKLALIYDRFMTDIPYEKWAGMICEYLRKNNVPKGRILDIGCGTGSLDHFLIRGGYSVYGIDASAEMIELAQRVKGDFGRLKLKFEVQDARAMSFSGHFDAAVSTCDALNYMRNMFDLKSVFERAALALKPGGFFIFDMKKEEYYRSLKCETFSESTENATYIWENEFDEKTRDNTYYMTFFVKDRLQLYRKYNEVHIQHAFTEEEITGAAEKDFEILKVLDMDIRKFYFCRRK